MKMCRWSRYRIQPDADRAMCNGIHQIRGYNLVQPGGRRSLCT